MPHLVDHRLIIGAAEDGAAGHESVGAGCRDALDVRHLDAAVDLEADVAAGSLDEAAGALDLAQRGVDEALAAEAGVHAHDQDQVDLVDDVLERIQRRGRVEGKPGLTPRSPVIFKKRKNST